MLVFGKKQYNVYGNLFRLVSQFLMMITTDYDASIRNVKVDGKSFVNYY